ncbi:MAG: 6,7-dimethyl-8-ribityllumazine synthase [Firmicutes bacterium]|nr:6,7-dimethyl-8-ribityllumazine synthase [Alicyclobacillaceae bacterium]MCL6497161.1 6,7-dimethyl-8-ribityllumazine synthase [Bacillota bacterium]
MAEYQGYLKTHQGQRWAIVVSRFNQRITDRLLEGAVDQLIRHGVPAESVDIFWVPGAFEIAGMVKRLLRRRYAAIMALGAIIRGETPHFEYIASATAGALAELARNGEVPVVFGVLTCNSEAEADARSDGKAGNKGAEAALAAIEMADLYRQVGND